MIEFELPDGTRFGLKALLHRLMPETQNMCYQQPVTSDPVLHRAVLNMHYHHAFEYVHRVTDLQTMRSLTMQSGMPLIYLYTSHEQTLRMRYQSLFGTNPAVVTNLHCLAQPLIQSLERILCLPPLQSDLSLDRKSTLPSEKPVYLIATLEQCDFLEACFLLNHQEYIRQDHLSLLDDPNLNILWSFSDFLTYRDVDTLHTLVTYVSPFPLNYEYNSSVTEDLNRAIKTKRGIEQLPAVFRVIVEMSQYFKSSQGSGWIEYLTLMTPMLQHVCASRLQLVKNLFFTKTHPPPEFNFVKPEITSALTDVVHSKPYTFCSANLDVAKLPTEKKNIRQFVMNKEKYYYERTQ